MAGRDLGAQRVPRRGLRERARFDECGDDRRAAGRELAQLRLVEIAVDQHRRRARDRRGRHDEDVGLVALAAQQRALLDAEAVLLVDHGEPELRESRVAVQQRVRADEDVDLARVETRARCAAVRPPSCGS